jgi:hypothetical protein
VGKVWRKHCLATFLAPFSLTRLVTLCLWRFSWRLIRRNLSSVNEASRFLSCSDCTPCGHVNLHLLGWWGEQGDQTGRIFAYCLIVFCQFCKHLFFQFTQWRCALRPIRWLFTLAVFFIYKSSTKILATFLHSIYALIVTKHCLGYILGDFFTKSSGHPGAREVGMGWELGCQMVCFHTKNTNLGKFWTVLRWKMLVYLCPIRSILRPSGIFYDFLVCYNIFSPFW